MSAKIKLFKSGKSGKGIYHYKIAVADNRRAPKSRFIEQLGTYDPTRDPAVVKVDKERALHWLKCGAEISDTVKSLFKQQGIKKEA